MIERLFTIGVYGKTEEQFFGQLLENRIQLFCDIRRRRGVRGSQYAFVNSTFLQRKLSNEGIVYRYFPALAPSQATREAQRAIDQEQGIRKRERHELGAEFKRRYTVEALESFDSRGFIESFDSHVSRIVLFCVEASARACHRSLLANRLNNDLGIPVENL